MLFLVSARGLKFTQIEDGAIQPFLANSPLFSRMLVVFGLGVVSAIIGVIEIVFGLGILSRRLWPRVSGFLIMDIILLGAAPYTAGEALRTSGRNR